MHARCRGPRLRGPVRVEPRVHVQHLRGSKPVRLTGFEEESTAGRLRRKRESAHNGDGRCALRPTWERLRASARSAKEESIRCSSAAPCRGGARCRTEARDVGRERAIARPPISGGGYLEELCVVEDDARRRLSYTGCEPQEGRVRGGECFDFSQPES